MEIYQFNKIYCNALSNPLLLKAYVTMTIRMSVFFTQISTTTSRAKSNSTISNTDTKCYLKLL